MIINIYIKMKANLLFTLIVASLILLSSEKSRDYERHLELSLLFYEAQRSGPLPENNRIYWRHDSMLEAGYDVDLDLTGGYYDAGDNCKFNYPGAGALTLITWSGIEFKEGYKKAGQWKYLLDMVKWGTDYFIKCHPEKNVFYIQVGDGHIDHGFWYPPEFINYPYPSYKIDEEHPGSDMAGEAAATFAAASILFRDVDSVYSETLLKHAKDVFEFADKFRGCYTKSVPEVKDFYGTSIDGIYDDLEWGALWLYKATEDHKYKQKFESLVAEDKSYNSWSTPINWSDKYGGVFILAAQLFRDERKYLTRAKKFAKDILDTDRTPGGLFFVPSLSRWGSNRHAANAASNLLFLANILPDYDENKQEYIKFGESQINYILGDNPLNINYVVGAEANSPKSVHHRAASCTYDGNGKPKENTFTLWGALAGGPGIEDDYSDDRGDYEKNEVAIDYNAGFTTCLAGLIKFGLGQRDPQDILHFERAWPKLSPVPNIKVEFTKSAVKVSTYNGLICGSFCVSFTTNTTIDKLSVNAHGVNLEGPKITICNGLENGHLDGKGTPQSLKYRLADAIYEEPEEFEVLCDGFHYPRSGQEPTYIPEYGHLYKVTKEGGLGGTTPLFDDGLCWPKFICEKEEKKSDPVNLYMLYNN
jgi:hypothetical protein